MHQKLLPPRHPYLYVKEVGATLNRQINWKDGNQIFAFTKCALCWWFNPRVCAPLISSGKLFAEITAFWRGRAGEINNRWQMDFLQQLKTICTCLFGRRIQAHVATTGELVPLDPLPRVSSRGHSSQLPQILFKRLSWGPSLEAMTSLCQVLLQLGSRTFVWATGSGWKSTWQPSSHCLPNNWLTVPRNPTNVSRLSLSLS